MAIVKTNTLIEGIRGKCGKNLVFKTIRGKVIACGPSAKPSTQSEQQRENRSRFKMASEWAKNELLDPARKEYYKKKALKLNLPNAYTAAITDYMRAPKILQTNSYHDKVVYSVVKKGFELKKVDVVITNSKGETTVRTLPQRDEYFRVSRDEIAAGVVVFVTGTSGTLHTLGVGLPATRILTSPKNATEALKH